MTTVYLRRNIVETQRVDPMDEGREPITMFVYEEAQMSKDEALLYLAEKQDTQSMDADSFSIDHEYRLALLELGLNETEEV